MIRPVLGFIALLHFIGFESHALAQTVVRRARMSHSLEAITTVGKDIVLCDGYEVFALAQENSLAKPRKLFDTRGLSIRSGVRGCVYLPQQHLFAFAEPTHPSQLLLSDAFGVPQGVVSIQLPPGVTANYIEGLTYIPATSSQYANHILAVLHPQSDVSTTRIEVIRLDGVVEKEILPDSSLNALFFVGITFLAPDKILLSDVQGDLVTLDFNGHQVGSTLSPPDLVGLDLEGLAQLSDGHIVATDYIQGKTYYFDGSLTRTPALDQNFGKGLTGATIGLGVTWDSVSEEYITPASSFGTQLFAINAQLNNTRVFGTRSDSNVLTTGAAYLASENLVALLSRNPKQVMLYNASGAPTGSVDVSVIADRIHSLSYVSTTNQFAIAGGQNIINFVDRTSGALTTSLTLNQISNIAAMAYFQDDDTGADRLLIADSGTNQMVVIDLTGAVLSQFDYRYTLGVVSPQGLSKITTGPDAGAFVVSEVDNSSLVVFRLQ